MTRPQPLRFREMEEKCIQPDCTGTYEYTPDLEACTCFNNPPCPACVEAPLVCSVCGDSTDDPLPEE